MPPEKNIVLITGANGRIGTELMRRLSARFSDVVGFDRKAPSPPPKIQETQRESMLVRLFALIQME